MKRVYLEELESTGNNLINYTQNNMAKVIEELKLATNNFVWQGPAYNSYIKGYMVRIQRLEKLNNDMKKIAEYMLRVKDEYSNANGKIENAYNELVDESKRIGV